MPFQTEYLPELDRKGVDARGPGAFTPSFPMKSGHVQTVFTGLSIRRPLVRHRALPMLAAARPRIISCKDGIRLCGYFSGHGRPSQRLAILIHGWCGDADSSYIISAAGSIWEQGYDIFRLNLRDHGQTKHLNRGLFHSCRINEVVCAVKEIQSVFARDNTFLLGFSLGGNFALRVALRAPGAGLAIDRVAAVSPVLDPAHTLYAIENGWQMYHRYYLTKWKEALNQKKKCFPDIKGLENLERFLTISGMTDYFVENFTEYPSTKDYLNGYTLTFDALAGLAVPALVISAKDDPVIPVNDFNHLPENDVVKTEIYPHGGHCGFFTGPLMKSHAEKRVEEFFRQSTTNELALVSGTSTSDI